MNERNMDPLPDFLKKENFLLNKNSPDFIPGPIQDVPYREHNFLSILRLDMIRSWADGNKYYKLKYNLREAFDKGITTIISKGGMYSNHLHSLAHACSYFGIRLMCVVRSYEEDPGNPLMQELRMMSHDILYLKPDEYKKFEEGDATRLFPGSYFIPEGGMNSLAMKGVAEILDECNPQTFSNIVIAGGTMTTACGLIGAASPQMKIIIVPAWKGCTVSYVENMLSAYHIQPVCEWEVWPDYHFGGFAKFNQDLVDFMYSFSKRTLVPLDPIYTGKMMFAIDDKMNSGYFSTGDSVLAIHTGGLRGLRGFSYKFPEVWSTYELSISDEAGKISF